MGAETATSIPSIRPTSTESAASATDLPPEVDAGVFGRSTRTRFESDFFGRSSGLGLRAIMFSSSCSGSGSWRRLFEVAWRDGVAGAERGGGVALVEAWCSKLKPKPTDGTAGAVGKGIDLCMGLRWTSMVVDSAMVKFRLAKQSADAGINIFKRFSFIVFFSA